MTTLARRPCTLPLVVVWRYEVADPAAPGHFLGTVDVPAGGLPWDAKEKARRKAAKRWGGEAADYGVRGPVTVYPRTFDVEGEE